MTPFILERQILHSDSNVRVKGERDANWKTGGTDWREHPHAALL